MHWTKSQNQNAREENVMQKKNFPKFENHILFLIGGGGLEG
jgi:hypothetical protein